MSVLSIKRGDDETRTVTVTMGGSAVGLETAQAVTFTAKRRHDDSDDDAVLRYELADGIEVAGNVATISFPAADTEELDAPAVLVWDVEVVDEDGKVGTVAEGYLRVTADVTRSAGLGS